MAIKSEPTQTGVRLVCTACWEALNLLNTGDSMTAFRRAKFQAAHDPCPRVLRSGAYPAIRPEGPRAA